MSKLRGTLYNIRYRLKFVLTGDCGHACEWLYPWGFVPEEDCPVHYRDSAAKAPTPTSTSYTVWER